MNTKKYVSLDKLSLYDEKIKKYLADADAVVLAESKAYSESLGKNYDAAGAAATVQGKLDEEVIRAKAREDEVAAAAAAAQKDVDDLEKYVGTLPEGSAATSVIDYVNVKTAGIATDAALGELNNQVTGLQGVVNGITADYLKAADKKELADAIKAEEDRAKGIEGGLETRLAAVEADYLKGADKTELQGAIDGVVEDVAEIAKDYLKGADKTELEGKIGAKADQTALDAEIQRATGIEGGLRTDVNAIKEDYLKAADKKELQDNIDTVAGALERLTDGISAEEIDGVNDLIAYVKDHGAEVIGMQEDIAENAKAISDHEALAAETYETKEDATAKYDEVVAMVDEKAVQADWNQNNPEAADYIKNRPFYESEGVLGEVLFDSTIESFTLDEQFGGYYNTDTIIIEDFVLEEGKTYAVTLDGETYYSECKRNYYCYIGGRDGATEEYPFSIYTPYTGYEYTLNIKVATPGSHTIKIAEAVQPTLVQLDEKFIPDTIARVSDIEVVEGRVEAAEGRLEIVEGKVATNEGAIAELVEADTAIKGRLDAVEAQLGDGEGSVADLIADAKTEVLEAAASDAAGKASAAEAAAKGHADGLNTAMDARVQALEAIDHEHANKAELDLIVTGDKAKWDAAAGKAHQHTNLEVLEGITAAKVTAWDGVEQAAKTYADGLNTAMNTRVAALETWHENFTEVSEAEINALFGTTTA